LTFSFDRTSVTLRARCLATRRRSSARYLTLLSPGSERAVHLCDEAFGLFPSRRRLTRAVEMCPDLARVKRRINWGGNHDSREEGNRVHGALRPVPPPIAEAGRCATRTSAAPRLAIRQGGQDIISRIKF
jgi:hypothetical protein